MGTRRAPAPQGSWSLASSEGDRARVRLEAFEPGQPLEKIRLATDGRV
jgi:hypothetical protein